MISTYSIYQFVGVSKNRSYEIQDHGRQGHSQADRRAAAVAVGVTSMRRWFEHFERR